MVLCKENTEDSSKQKCKHIDVLPCFYSQQQSDTLKEYIQWCSVVIGYLQSVFLNNPALSVVFAVLNWFDQLESNRMSRVRNE